MLRAEVSYRRRTHGQHSYPGIQWNPDYDNYWVQAFTHEVDGFNAIADRTGIGSIMDWRSGQYITMDQATSRLYQNGSSSFYGSDISSTKGMSTVTDSAGTALALSRSADGSLAGRAIGGTGSLARMSAIANAPNNGSLTLQNGDFVASGVVNKNAGPAAAAFTPGTYKTFGDATSAAANAAYNFGQKYRAEFGGWIYQKSPGEYTFTFRSDGQSNNVDPGMWPAGGGVAFHNHLDLGGAASWTPGPLDYVVSALRGGWHDVLIDPHGQIFRYQGTPTPDFWGTLQNLGLSNIVNNQVSPQSLVPYVVQQKPEPVGWVDSPRF